MPKTETKPKKHEHKIGDVVVPNVGPHKGVKHSVIHVKGDNINIKPHIHDPKLIYYRLGATSALPHQLVHKRTTKEETEMTDNLAEANKRVQRKHSRNPDYTIADMSGEGVKEVRKTYKKHERTNQAIAKWHNTNPSVRGKPIHVMHDERGASTMFGIKKRFNNEEYMSEEVTLDLLSNIASGNNNDAANMFNFLLADRIDDLLVDAKRAVATQMFTQEEEYAGEETDEDIELITEDEFNALSEEEQAEWEEVELEEMCKVPETSGYKGGNKRIVKKWKKQDADAENDEVGKTGKARRGSLGLQKHFDRVMWSKPYKKANEEVEHLDELSKFERQTNKENNRYNRDMVRSDKGWKNKTSEKPFSGILPKIKEAPKSRKHASNWIKRSEEVEHLDELDNKLYQAASKAKENIRANVKWSAAHERNQPGTGVYAAGKVGEKSEPKIGVVAKNNRLLQKIKDRVVGKTLGTWNPKKTKSYNWKKHKPYAEEVVLETSDAKAARYLEAAKKDISSTSKHSPSWKKKTGYGDYAAAGTHSSGPRKFTKKDGTEGTAPAVTRPNEVVFRKRKHGTEMATNKLLRLSGDTLAPSRSQTARRTAGK